MCDLGLEIVNFWVDVLGDDLRRGGRWGKGGGLARKGVAVLCPRVSELSWPYERQAAGPEAGPQDRVLFTAISRGSFAKRESYRLRVDRDGGSALSKQG